MPWDAMGMTDAMSPKKKRRGNGPTNLWLCDVLVFGES